MANASKLLHRYKRRPDEPVEIYLTRFMTYHNDRYGRVSLDTLLGVAAQRGATSYWEIIGRDNPRRGIATVRRHPRRRNTAPNWPEESSGAVRNS